jgi:chromosome segregation ATPase
MARAGVNYTQVAQAAEAIKQGDIEPTVDRVRERLGTGSKSTIAPLLKQWKAQNAAAIDVSGLPRDLVEVVKSLYGRVQQDAELKIEEISSSFNETNDHLQQQVSAAQEHNLSLTEKNSALTLLNQVHTKELEILRARGIKQEAETISNASLISNLKTTIKEAKGQIEAATARLEHYQTQVAQERQSSNQQQQQLTQQFQNQVKQLSLQNSDVNSKLYDQQQLLNTKDREFYRLVTEKQQLENKLSITSTTIEELHAEIALNLEAHQQLNVKYKTIKKDYSEAVTNQLSTDNVLKQLNNNLVDKQYQLNILNDKLSLSDDNYKLLLQEKASIAGQFKQLQDSF